MLLLLFGTLGVIALVAWFFIPGKPSPKCLDDSPDALAKALEYLRILGLEAGELRIQAKDNDQMMVVINKHIVALNNIELRGTVTDEAMQDGAYEAVEAALAARGILYGKVDLHGRRTLVLRVRESLAELEAFVETAMLSGFGKTVSSDCVAYFRNVLIWNMPSVTGVSGRRSAFNL